MSTRLLIYLAEGVKVLAALHAHGSGRDVQKSRCSGYSGYIELLTAASMPTQLGAMLQTWLGGEAQRSQGKLPRAWGGRRALADTVDDDDPAGLNAQGYRERGCLAAGTMTASYEGLVTGDEVLRASARGTNTAGFAGCKPAVVVLTSLATSPETAGLGE